MKRLVIIILLIAGVATGNAQMMDFPYPQIPATLATPSDRGAYLLEHYWGNYDFADTALVDKPEIVEQGFANFIDLLPRFDSSAAVKGIEVFSDKAYGGKTPVKVADRFEAMVEHYLADPNSPMRNEDLYILFLEAQIKAMTASGADAARPKARLVTVKKNRPGTMAADISFTTRSGQRSSLYATEAKMLLLVFYDPACGHCEEILAQLRNDSQLSQLIANGTLSVLAVYTEGDDALWKETNGNLPKEWTVAIDESGIVAHEIYDIPAMPVLYLLDKDKKVLLKDPSIDGLMYYLKNMNIN